MSEETKKTNIRDALMQVAISAIKNGDIDPTSQVDSLINYAASDSNFASVLKSKDARVINELKTQFKFICELGLNVARNRKLVYVKTRGLNIAEMNQQKVWLTMPDIQISYHALILILIRSKSINSINVYHTYEKYPISYSGNPSDTPIVKSWEVKPEERGEYTGCFVVVTDGDDKCKTSYHHAADIDEFHRKYSKTANTWLKFRPAMSAKSAIVEATKYIPLLEETAQMVLDDYEKNQDWVKEETINEVQIAELTKMSEETKTDLFSLFAFLKKDKFQDISVSQYKEAVNFMNTTKEDVVNETK